MRDQRNVDDILLEWAGGDGLDEGVDPAYDDYRRYMDTRGLHDVVANDERYPRAVKLVRGAGLKITRIMPVAGDWPAIGGTKDGRRMQLILDLDGAWVERGLLGSPIVQAYVEGIRTTIHDGR
jgi:hypothetical protein